MPNKGIQLLSLTKNSTYLSSLKRSLEPVHFNVYTKTLRCLAIKKLSETKRFTIEVLVF